LPRNYGEGAAVGLFNPIWHGQLGHLRRVAKHSDPVLIELPAWASSDRGQLARRTFELAMRMPPALLPQAIGSLEALVEAHGAEE
jgi:hypothetical protein